MGDRCEPVQRCSAVRTHLLQPSLRSCQLQRIPWAAQLLDHTSATGRRMVRTCRSDAAGEVGPVFTHNCLAAFFTHRRRSRNTHTCAPHCLPVARKGAAARGAPRVASLRSSHHEQPPRIG
eukprot:2009883-Prymnesium_polylepis.1